jgi:hypothetical protein
MIISVMGVTDMSGDQWEAYDSLPAAAKRALQDAVFNWASQPILTRWKRGDRGYKTGADIAVRVAQSDKHQIAKLGRESEGG